MASILTWTPDRIDDLAGRTALVTGANSGLGFWTTQHLAAHGAHVVMACRSADRASAALVELRAAVPDGSFEIIRLDLADLASVRTATEKFLADHARLDLLCNNAGVAMLPQARTNDGFELHLGANHLGHFALTAQLAPALLATPHARIVHVGSLQHRLGRLGFDDLHFEHRTYRPWSAYGQSKMATLTFMLELDRRLRRTGASVASLGSHPGAAGTGIIDEMPLIGAPRLRPAAEWVQSRLLHSPEHAAFPTLYAATDPDVSGGEYYGPSGLLEIKGSPAPATLAKRARRESDAQRLWEVSERLTGVSFDLT